MARKIEHIDKIDQHIGQKIQELRLFLGMSRQQLGDLIEVTHQQLQKYEKGSNRVSAGRLAIIAKFLQKPITYFYEGMDQSSDSYEEMPNMSQHQRLCIEVSRNFMKIKSPEYKDAINTLVRTLANKEEENNE